MKGIEAKLGALYAVGGDLHWSVSVDESGRVWVDLYASPKTSRQGVLLRFSPGGLQGIQEKLDEAIAMVERMRPAKPLTG